MRLHNTPILIVCGIVIWLALFVASIYSDCLVTCESPDSGPTCSSSNALNRSRTCQNPSGVIQCPDIQDVVNSESCPSTRLSGDGESGRNGATPLNRTCAFIIMGCQGGACVPLSTGTDTVTCYAPSGTLCTGCPPQGGGGPPNEDPPFDP